MQNPNTRRLIFITGTDTGVGKTLLTGLLVYHLRQAGCHALAMKPFCSGGRGDVDFLRAAQDGELTAKEVNPFFFREPVAPLVSARKRRATVRLPDVLRAIGGLVRRCECLLIEGSGGLLVPLGEGYTVADLISKLNCEVIVVSRNRLGTINHTLLTVRALQHVGIKALSVVLMSEKKGDKSRASNAKILGELLGCTPLLPVDYLGGSNLTKAALKKNCKKIKKTLARILGCDNVSPTLFFASQEIGGEKSRKKILTTARRQVM